MDDLTKLLSRFSLHAGVFYTGNICGIHDFPADALRDHIHLIRPASAICRAWRVMTAQGLLKRGRPLKHVASDVGYASASALTRAFVRKLGCSPTEWLKENKK